MNKAQKTILFIIWLAVMIWGLTGVFQRLVHGELLVNYGSYVPWGLWVAAKTYFVGISVGASILAWVVYAFDIKQLRPVVRPALLVSAATMVAGLIVISFDLGHMWRTYEVFTRPNFSSMLAIATWLSMAHLIYVIAALAIELKPGRTHSSTLRIMGWFGLFLAVTFSGGNGAEFAAMISSPYWHSSLGPIMSIGGALLSGVALVLASVALFPFSPEQDNPQLLKILGRTVVGLIFFILLLEWSEFSISMWYARGEDYNLLYSILFGPYAYVFWFFHIILGSIIPLILLLWKPAQRLSAGFGGAMVAVFYFAVRLNHVIPGQVTPAMKGLQQAYTDKWLTFAYFPSSNEWAVFGFSVALSVAIFYLGIRYLPFSTTNSIEERGE